MSHASAEDSFSTALEVVQQQQPPPPADARGVQQMIQGEPEQILENVQEIFSQEKPRQESFPAIVCRALFNVPFHPVRYIQLLIQLGHEPVQPQRRFSFVFQRYMYYYPGLLGYARTIVNEEGWKGLYRGAGCVLVENIVGMYAANVLYPSVRSLVNKIPLPFKSRDPAGDVPDTDPNYAETWPSILTRASRSFLYGTLTNCSVQLIVHPFHVISTRNMAQFIGKENVYKGLWPSAKEIYQCEGLKGFYAGIIPALIGQVISCLIHSALWLMFEVIIANVSMKLAKVSIRTVVAMPLLAYIPRSYTYPFFLLTNIMAVNDTPLKAGSPPMMPVFSGWRDGYRYLRNTGSLYRGSVVIFSRFAYKDRP